MRRPSRTRTPAALGDGGAHPLFAGAFERPFALGPCVVAEFARDRLNLFEFVERRVVLERGWRLDDELRGILGGGPVRARRGALELGVAV